MGTSPARRARLRARRLEQQRKAAEVVRLRRAAGHSCGDCRHRDQRYGQMTCSLGDEWDCYLPTTLDNLCWQWTARTPDPAAKPERTS